jgi:hypothetical protein
LLLAGTGAAWGCYRLQNHQIAECITEYRGDKRRYENAERQIEVACGWEQLQYWLVWIDERLHMDPKMSVRCDMWCFLNTLSSIGQRLTVTRSHRLM